MRSKLQLIAGMAAALFLVIGGLPVAYGQQNGAAGTQQKTTAAVQQNAAAGTQQSSITSRDKKFAASALTDGMLQIAMAKQALAKTSEPDVKSFANRIIKDHTSADQELQQIAQKENLQLPDKMTAGQQARLKKMSELQGVKFDLAYTGFAVRSHKHAIKAFKKEVKKGSDSALKSFASKVLPDLRQHLSMAESVNQKVTQAAKPPWWEFWKRV